MIANIKRNRLGTASFDGQFKGMRKPQDFIVYPIKGNDGYITIQSDTRIGTVNLDTGFVELAGPIASGAYFHHLVSRKYCGALSGEELLTLKAQIACTSSAKAGSNGVIYTDNSGAISVLGERA
jgi:hypothetical protein